MRKLAVAVVFVVALVSMQAASAMAATPVQLGTGEKPWVLVDRAGVTHVVWTVQPAGGLSELHYRSAPAGSRTFSADRILAAGDGQDAAGPIILQDPAPSDRLVILTERCCTPATLNALVSTDGGANWSAPTSVFDDQIGAVVASGSGGRPNRAAIGPAGIYVVYQVSSDFKLLQIPLGLAPAVTKDTVPQISPNPFDASIAYDETGQPVLAWTDQTTSFFRRGTAGGDNSAGAGNPIKVASGPKGTVLLQDSGSATDRSLYAKKLSGTSAGAPVRVSDPADNAPRFPHLASDASGRFHAAWLSDNPRQLYYSASSDGARWIPPTEIVSAGDQIFDPFVAADSGGRGWIAWDQNSATGQVSAAPITAKTATVDPGNKFRRTVSGNTFTLTASSKCVTKGSAYRPTVSTKRKRRSAPKLGVTKVQFKVDSKGPRKTDKKKPFKSRLPITLPDASEHTLRARVYYRSRGKGKASASKDRSKTLTRTFGVCVS